MGNTLEIACSTSAVAAALAYLAYKVSEGQSTLPVEVNGEMVFVPKPLIDALYDVANFSVRYNMVIKGFHEGPRAPEDQYAVILQAEKKWQRYVSITRMTIFMNLEWVGNPCSVNDDFNMLYERVTTICAKGEEVEDDLVAFREAQKVRIEEVQVT